MNLNENTIYKIDSLLEEVISRRGFLKLGAVTAAAPLMAKTQKIGDDAKLAAEGAASSYAAQKAYSGNDRRAFLTGLAGGTVAPIKNKGKRAGAILGKLRSMISMPGEKEDFKRKQKTYSNVGKTFTALSPLVLARKNYIESGGDLGKVIKNQLIYNTPGGQTLFTAMSGLQTAQSLHNKNVPKTTSNLLNLHTGGQKMNPTVPANLLASLA